MKLDRTTYEAWLLDRMEGNLAPHQERELDAFLSANPDLPTGAGAEGDEVSVHALDEGFDEKDMLKRMLPPQGVPTERTIGDFLIAWHEGDLSKEQVDAVRRFLAAHPRFERDAKLTAATYVTDKSTVFAGKNELLRAFPPQGLPEARRLDDFLVARLEGDLDLQQRVALDRLIATDARAAQQWALMSRAVIAREAVVFAGKEQLKKKRARVIAISGGGWMRFAAAASIALVLGLGWVVLSRSGGVDPVGPGLADEHPIAPQRTQHSEQERNGDTIVEDPTETKEAPSAPSNEGPAQYQLPGPGNATPGRQVDEPARAPDRAAPERRAMDDEPMLAQTQRPALERDPVHAQPVSVPHTTGPAPAPMEDALAAVPEHFTIGQVLTGAVRREVLGQPGVEDRALDGSDAVAALDKGLAAISGDRAGIEAQRTGQRSRFRLQLGRVAVSASTGR